MRVNVLVEHGPGRENEVVGFARGDDIYRIEDFLELYGYRIDHRLTAYRVHIMGRSHAVLLIPALEEDDALTEFTDGDSLREAVCQAKLFQPAGMP